ncbi:SDR family oxidoreductase [Pseudooceanicola nitratireducens]|uniref:SDR family oxidoreductase n=1 Tax=Pseudooceanicola nitratireducens TaxID=517719 RepID=UPI001C94B044|nr:SDR family NAD(P)-dependent oxidoreductase [Pseudooceanicola nitratireducens]MBY6155842.1 SDR family oxidoreductase [Pseudooceanicola nitratireducens]
MDITGKIAIVTGGGQGIGAALARALHAAGAKHVCVADLNGDNARAVAEEIGGTGLQVDVRDADQITAMIDQIEADHGPVDLMCSNAGIANAFDLSVKNAAGASAEDWQLAWEVNVMSHVHAAKVLVPRMIARGGGYFLHTVSAAGLLSQIGSATYSTTKHAAVGFAENLAISHRDEGIRVSILCPQGVATPMLDSIDNQGPQSGDGVLTAEAVAQSALDGIRNEEFLILPHPQVQGYIEAKAAQYNRWIGGMAKFQRQYRET